MNKIIKEQHIEKGNRKAIKFIVTLFLLYVIFSQGNLFMNSVMSTGGAHYHKYLAEHLNYIQGLRNILIKPSIWIIKAFGFYAIHNETDLMVVNGPLLRINYSCLGLGVMSFLAAFVFSFPARWEERIKMLIIGIFSIYLLNVIRIAGLGLLFGYFHSQRNYFEYHHEIFNLFVYSVVFVMLYGWANKNAGSFSNSKFTKRKIE
ncbi:exosortase Y [Pedobacter sp. Leaf176]|uniref:exosortase Y n=1 Tax=Pedobacter sp. Leaf176 TaxID=1736286 RepID=UPI0006F5CC1D|nr:archaeosortase/exosortase family protein [Pedobacter sp. Leaf176]KQR72681.1 hypothetical protein ASF92_05250 [Pedobacter sp. Leaf176]